MGKPATSPLPGIGDSSSDAVSLHTQPGDRAYDDDVPELQSDDLPPLYSEHEAADSAPLLAPSFEHFYLLDKDDDGGSLYTVDQNTGAEVLICGRLDDNPALLEARIKKAASKPPRPSIRVRGTHSETVKQNGKSEKKTIVDFDVHVDLTPYLFSDASRGTSWSTLRSVSSNDKVRRGTIFRKRAPGVSQDISLPDDNMSSIAEWCHRYCASPASLKSLVLRRQVAGLKTERLKEKLEALVRSTNYRGKVCVTFPVYDQEVTFMNECKINRWRLTPWIVWMCYLTFMWLFTWPYLFFCTKVFEVAVAEWIFALTQADGTRKFVSMSEEHIYNMWARAISQAVLGRRQCTLDQDDLIASQVAPEQPFGNALEGAPRFLREGINAITAVNRQLGWGGDSW